ncbi:hypothetical protein ACFWFZ_20575 [Streptomyces sp. NPDC060232]|uniref:hypothetical protein n=1 Tax=Streptomyces sp. NPDC060232 TaxID=3347079 RepID=UPI0036653CD3
MPAAGDEDRRAGVQDRLHPYERYEARGRLTGLVRLLDGIPTMGHEPPTRTG